MKTHRTLLLTLGLSAIVAASPTLTPATQLPTTNPSQIPMARAMNDQPSFQSAMRQLWEDHVTWTRLFIVSAAHNLPNKEATTARLLQNQLDIGNAMKPIYGDEAGRKLSALLKEHILIAAEIITAAQDRDANRVTDQKEQWFDNSDQIADFLHNVNPNHWPRSEMRDMMRSHLDLTLEEAVAEINGDYRTSVRKYDQVHLQILKMADMLSEGIRSQFPEKYALDAYVTRNEPTRLMSLTMDAGTVLPFTLNQKLSSNKSSVGDRFTANIETGEYSNYQGLGNGAILEGHVDVARAKTGNTPGVLGLAFDRVRMPNGQTLRVYGTLIGLDSKSVVNENGRLVAKPGAKNDNLKYLGYGAGAGALVSVLTKGNVLNNALIGGALGYLYGEIQRSPSKARNVTAEPGMRFGVRLTRDLSFQTTSAPRQTLKTQARDR